MSLPQTNYPFRLKASDSFVLDAASNFTGTDVEAVLAEISTTIGALDHGNSLTGLGDDDHTQYLLADGTRDLTGNWLTTSANEHRFRATTNRVYSDAVDSLSIEGNLTTKVGKDGDVILGDALTSLVLYPNVDGAFSLGKSGNTFLDLHLSGDIIHTGTNIGFYSTTPVAQSTGWAVTNLSSDKVYDADATSVDEIADILGTLITYLISRGDLAA